MLKRKSFPIAILYMSNNKNTLDNYSISKNICINIYTHILDNVGLNDNEYVHIMNNYCWQYYFDSLFGENMFKLILSSDADIDIYVISHSSSRQKFIHSNIHDLLNNKVIDISNRATAYLTGNEIANVDYYDDHKYSEQTHNYFRNQVMTMYRLSADIDKNNMLSNTFNDVMHLIVNGSVKNLHEINYSDPKLDPLKKYFNTYQNMVDTLDNYHDYIYNISNINDMADIFNKKICYNTLNKITPLMVFLDIYLPKNRVQDTSYIYDVYADKLFKEYHQYTTRSNVQYSDNKYNIIVSSNNLSGQHYKVNIQYLNNILDHNKRLFFGNVSYNIFGYDHYIQEYDQYFMILNTINDIDTCHRHINSILFMAYLKYNRSTSKIIDILPIFDTDGDNNMYISKLRIYNIITHDSEYEYIINKLQNGSVHFSQIVDLNKKIADIGCVYMLKYCIVHRLVTLNGDNGQNIRNIFSEAFRLITMMATN